MLAQVHRRRVLVARSPVATAADAAATTAFLARTSGLDATHTNAYKALINGLVSDGVWAKLDLLQIYATQDATTALLNLVSTSYPATVSGSPTFTADGGYTTASGKYIDTGFAFNAGVNYTQNAASLLVWSGSNVAAATNNKILTSAAAFNGSANLQPRSSTDVAVLLLNDTSAITSPANTDGSGFYAGIRTNSTTKQLWKDGVQMGGDITRASVALQAVNLQTGGNNAVASNAYAGIVRAVGAGGTLSAGDNANLYAHLRTYMTAIGVTGN